ncbi:tetratricopeptide repeat 27-like protein [Micractinium conductrix]|uniref:Tetratricopeptide repeat 27-like protein n=1 Tax=Micractinium conductrix TaxID=554055 RepID=A0A2P6VP61_9CHLO|nr:tetratricopeptide repeat 27-like protein [Micractinium conductrix]|eukprot:PSC75849.1 tetratricopeptide repeat 27-like protein [Micractinium conductrix]
MAAAAAGGGGGALERRLLLGSLAAADADSLPTGTGVPALALLEAGDYAGALAAALRSAWAAGGGAADVATPESTPDWFEAAAPLFKQALTGDGPADAASAADQLLLAAAAALCLFAQANLVGPVLPLPECPFDWMDAPEETEWRQRRQQQEEQQRGGGGGGGESSASDAGFGRDSTSPGDRWAAAQLCEDGEDPVGRIHSPQYLLLARLVLLTPLEVAPAGSGGDGAAVPVAGTPATVQPAAGAGWLNGGRLAGWAWWALRAVLLQQRLLSGRSASLRSLLLGLAAPVLAGLAAPVEQRLAALAGGGGSGGGSGGFEPPSPAEQLLAAGALLEAALLETAYGHVEATKALLQRSSAVLGFQSELTGALGMRTVHQREARAQLLVSVSREEGNPWTTAHAARALPDRAAPQAEIEAVCHGRVELPAELKGFTADSDVLPHPQLVEGAGGAATPADLHSLEQALLLAWCLHVRKGSAADGLQPWEMAAYVDAVARQERTQFLLHTAAALQASRLEKQRSRTRDRALLQLEQLAEVVDKAAAGLTPEMRLRYAFSVWFPLRLQLRKELGELLVGMGLVGGALAVFETLELWDNLIVCYQLLGKKVQAEELIKRRLEVTPDEPRLWCALGDLTLDDAHYLHAWERSGHRNARSQRSLARNALRNNRYVKAAQHWEAALALNPLHGEGWFSLGYCYIKEKDYPAAMRAFTRSSQLEPENGEAWNNLAAIHMHLQHWPQAYNALTEAVKHKRDSWQTWENYAQVSASVGQWQTAVRALQQVLMLSEGRRVNLEVVAALVGQVEKGRRGEDGSAGTPHGAAEQRQQQQQQQPDAALAAEGAMPAAAGEPSSAALAELASALGELGVGGAGSAASGGAAAQAEAVVLAEARSQGVLEQAVGGLMKQVAATVSGDSSFWEIYARFQTALGYPDAAKECLLKRVRALGGAGWAAGADGFETYAHASEALCEAYLQAAAAGGAGAPRELSSARMHLRGLLKQAAEQYEETGAYKRLQELAARVDAAQQAASQAAVQQ